MTRDQRLVALLLIAFVLIVALGLASHTARGIEPPAVTPLPSSAFRDVTASRPAADIRPVERVDLSALPGAGTSQPPTGAPIIPAATRSVQASPEPTDAAVRGSTQTPAAATPLPVISLGVASWYADGNGYYAAVGDWHWGDPPYPVAVCTIAAGRSLCVTVTVRDACAGCRDGRPLIDLSPDAFRVLAPLSAGVVRVSVEGLR